MASALVLNATYEPLGVVPVRRAVTLLLVGKAEPLHVAERGQIRSASLVLAVPTVIRLSRYVVVPYRSAVPLTRHGVLRRDRGVCAYCGERASSLDHVIPRSRGGRHDWDNVVACCIRCNGRKGNQLLADLGWRLRVQPRVPAGPHVLVARFGEVHPHWAPYVPGIAA